MKKKEKKPHSPSRQLELLRHYFPVDDEKKTITFPLSYDSVWDVLADDVSTPEHPFVQDDIPERMGQLIREVPVEYKANFHFEITDYDGYKPEAILNALNDAIELNHYHSNRDHTKKLFTAVLMMVVGIIGLFLMFIGSVNGWYGQGQTQDIIVEVIDIFAWVFIWESVSILFLEPSKTTALDILLKRRVKEIGFYDVKDHTTCYIKQEQSLIQKNWENDSRVKRTGMNFLLFSGGALIALSITNFVASILHIVGPQTNVNGDTFYFSGGVITLLIILAFLSAGVYFLAGFCAVSAYVGRGRLAKAIPVFAVFALVAVVLNIIFGISQKHYSISWASGFAFIVLLFYAVGYFMQRAGKKKRDNKLS